MRAERKGDDTEMKIKRWVAALLCVMLIGSLFPTSAFAERSEGIAYPDKCRKQNLSHGLGVINYRGGKNGKKNF